MRPLVDIVCLTILAWVPVVWLIVLLLKRYLVPDYLQNPVLLGLVVVLFATSNHLQEESGLITVTVMGLILANQRQVAVKHVVEFKDRFYHSAAAHYELAKPGTFRLIPEEAKLRALDRDYREMQVMFFSHPPAWEVVVSTLSSLEKRINGLEG